MTETRLRWRLASDDGGQAALFEEEVNRNVGTGEFRGLEFLEVNAKSIINEVPAASRMPFRYTINAYRGCSHACAYCQGPDTPVLMADGRHRRIADLRPGDEIMGTVRVGSYRRYTRTRVVAHWSTVKPGYRITLADGTELIASGDHRYLTRRGWKHVTGTEQGSRRRPHLTLKSALLGTGHFTEQPKHDEEYRRGYLAGMIRGDGTIGHREYLRPNGQPWTSHQFRLALSDEEALLRTSRFLAHAGVETQSFAFAPGTDRWAPMSAIRTQKRASVQRIEELIEWPTRPSDQWRRGFLAGFFDAEGDRNSGVLRMFNTDHVIIDVATGALRALGFQFVIETQRGTKRPVTVIRLPGGLREHLRFFHAVDPAISRKRRIDGYALKSDTDLRVMSIEPLGFEMPMYDITTGTGDFIADGVVSHNCFARPTHEYLGLDIGRDFETKLVVKVNAVERVRAELRSPKWQGDHIAMGTNTDPYQRCEGKYHLTQGIVRELGEARNPFSILTKSTLILRDLDLLRWAAGRTSVRANFSIGTLDEQVWKATEPGTPHPRRRVEAVRKLNDAGIECGVLVAPIIPGMSDGRGMVEEVVAACMDAGAVSVSAIGLHLRPGVREHFMASLAGARPDLVADYRRRYTGAYLPKAEQEALSARVRTAAAEADGRAISPARTRIVDGDRPIDERLAEQGFGARPVQAPEPPAPTQLGLDL